MKAFRDDHISNNIDEIIRLQAIYTSEHLSDNEVAQLFINNKYIIRMSAQTFELLLTFLQEKKLMSILNILNQYIQINVFTKYPEEKDIPPPPSDTLWGVVEEKSLDRADGLSSSPVSDDEEDQDTKKRRREPKKKAKTTKRKKKEEDEEVIDITPMDPQAVESELEQLNALREKLNSEDNSLPSIRFYSVSNPSYNLNVSLSSYDQSLFACGYGDSVIKVWDQVGSSRCQYMSKLDGFDFKDSRDHKGLVKLARSHYFDLIGHTQPVFGLNFSKDNRYLLSSSSDSTVRLWSMDTKEAISIYRGHSFPVWNAKFSPLGHYFASASCDRTARLWSTDYTHPLRVFAGHLGDVNTVDFHPNSNYILTGSGDKTLRFWELHTGECVRIFTGHLSGIHCTVVSPDGKHAISGGEDRDIMIWDLNAGKMAHVLKGHNAVVWSIDISEQGNLLATGSGDGTVKLWDMRNLQEDPQSESRALLGTYQTKSKSPVFSVGFGQNNVLLASGPLKTSPLRN